MCFPMVCTVSIFQPNVSFKPSLILLVKICLKLTNERNIFSGQIINFLHIKLLTEKLFHTKTSFMSVFKTLHQHPAQAPFRVTPGHFLMSFT